MQNIAKPTKVVIMERPFEIKPCSKKELYEAMNVSKYIFNKWIKALQPKLGEPLGGLYNPKQVLLIIEAYGVPCQVVNEAA